MCIAEVLRLVRGSRRMPMSRIFEDQDAKALLLVSALLFGVLLLAGLTVPKGQDAPLAVATSSALVGPR